MFEGERFWNIKDLQKFPFETAVWINTSHPEVNAAEVWIWAPHCSSVVCGKPFCFAHRSSDSRFDFLGEITMKWLEQKADWAACSTVSGNFCLKWETRAARILWTWRPISHVFKWLRRSWCVFLGASCSKVRRGQGDLQAASLGSLTNIAGLGLSPASSFGWHLCYLLI